MKSSFFFVLGSVGLTAGLVLLLVVSFLPDACTVKQNLVEDSERLMQEDPEEWTEERVAKRVENMGYLCSGQAALYTLIVVGIIGGGVCMIIYRSIESSSSGHEKRRSRRKYFS
jgi:hypothetical protein